MRQYYYFKPSASHNKFIHLTIFKQCTRCSATFTSNKTKVFLSVSIFYKIHAVEIIDITTWLMA